MNLSLFLKSVGPLGLGSGLGVGGVALYKNTAPANWKELLEREGVYLISTDEDYKAIFYDQEGKRKTISGLENETKVDDAHSKIKTWCEDELKKSPESGDTLKDQKAKIIDLCSHNGIKSVKGRIAQTGKTNWIADLETDADSKYKTIFAIYKHYSPFLEWLNEGKEEDKKVKDSDSTESKYSELKSKCQEVVKKDYLDSPDDNIYNYAFWWCQPLSYSKVEDRIKTLDTSWKKATNWETIYTKWKETSRVTDVIKEDKQEDKQEDINKDSFKNFCDKWLEKELTEEGVYQDKYLIVKAVCRED